MTHGVVYNKRFWLIVTGVVRFKSLRFCDDNICITDGAREVHGILLYLFDLCCPCDYMNKSNRINREYNYVLEQSLHVKNWQAIFASTKHAERGAAHAESREPLPTWTMMTEVGWYKHPQ